MLTEYMHLTPLHSKTLLKWRERDLKYLELRSSEREKADLEDFKKLNSESTVKKARKQTMYTTKLPQASGINAIKFSLASCAVQRSACCHKAQELSLSILHSSQVKGAPENEFHGTKLFLNPLHMASGFLTWHGSIWSPFAALGAILFSRGNLFPCKALCCTASNLWYEKLNEVLHIGWVKRNYTMFFPP